MRIHGFVSKPEIQKLNRNSIFVFVNGRLIRDRLVQHALTEAYRNIIPPTVYPVVLLFLELPAGEVDVNVHPSKTEVRFRQQSVMHDFVRDSVRAALMKARPVPQFVTEMRAHATASQALTPGALTPALTPGARFQRFLGMVGSRRLAFSFRKHERCEQPGRRRISHCRRRCRHQSPRAFSSKVASRSRRMPQFPWRARAGRNSRQRMRSGARRQRRRADAVLARHAQAAGTDSQFVHPRGE